MRPTLKRLLHTLILLLGFTALSANAQASVAPHQMLEQVTQKMFDVLRTEQEAILQKHEHLFDVVEQVLLPHVDLSVMSRYVLGKHWRDASEQQRERFTVEFKNLMVRFYVSALLEDPKQLEELLSDGESLITYLPVETDDSTKKTRVRAEVHMPNGGPRIPVSFSLFKKDGNWLIYDVNVDGISLVSNYRSSFASEMKTEGLDKLIDRLTQRNAELLQATRDKQAGVTAAQ